MHTEKHAVQECIKLYSHTATNCNTMSDTAAPLYKQFLQEILLRTHVIANTEPNVGHNFITVRIILVANAVKLHQW